MANQNIGDLTGLAVGSIDRSNDKFVIWDSSASGSARTKSVVASGVILSTDVTYVPTAYVLIKDIKANGTSGGTFTSGSWQDRTLNTLEADTTSGVTLSSNTITLPAGVWRCRIICPAIQVNSHQARLQNITDSTTVLTGTSEYSDNTIGGHNTNPSFIVGRFTLSAAKDLKVQHRCSVTVSGYGFGAACSFGDEVYTIAEFWRERG